MRSWPLGFVALGLVLSCWTVALRSWASALRKSSASGSDLLRRLGLSIGIAAHRHFCTSERRYDGTTVRRNDARDGGRFSAPLRASSIYIYIYLKGFAPMPPAPCFLWNGGYEAKWLRKSGSLAWLGAWETLGKTKKGSKIKF